jgi:hypothetical protein
VGLGAIVVIGAGSEGLRPVAQNSHAESLLAEPIECVEILGSSMLQRTIEHFTRSDVQAITMLVPGSCSVPALARTYSSVKALAVSDVGSAIAQQLNDYSQNGIDHSFIASTSLYAEADLLDLFYFHREARQAATRGLDREGPLDLWVVNCEKALQTGLDNLLTRADETSPSYFIRDYVSRLTHPRDLRRLVSDALCGRCAMRPSGREVKPGVWVEEGAEIHRGARIVAPAYIGAGSEVQEDSLITRCSSVEKSCYVDCGTVIEDSSILANTHVGIWLDVCHAIASGNKLLSLEHEVMVEISDASVLRSNGAVGPESEHRACQDEGVEQQIVAAISPEQPPTPQTCGLEPIYPGVTDNV